MISLLYSKLLLFNPLVVSDSFATPRIVALQVPLSLEFSRQQYWSGCHSLVQGIFLTQRSALQLDFLPLSHLESHSKPDHLIQSKN